MRAGHGQPAALGHLHRAGREPRNFDGESGDNSAAPPPKASRPPLAAFFPASPPPARRRTQQRTAWGGAAGSAPPFSPFSKPSRLHHSSKREQRSLLLRGTEPQLISESVKAHRALNAGLVALYHGLINFLWAILHSHHYTINQLI